MVVHSHVATAADVIEFLVLQQILNHEKEAVTNELVKYLVSDNSIPWSSRTEFVQHLPMHIIITPTFS